ncbi:protein-export membrane protein SecD [Lachnospiraceae bacterium KM106-2]|nr:protein-export membrane protein SecD [Lachnospiraceae bacterium KM106-2]
MKNTKKGILQLLFIVVVIGALSTVALVGVGKNKIGSAKKIKLGLDLAGGVSITYQTQKSNPTDTEMKDTIYKMQKRVENYSTESEVYQEGSDRINIDIPGEDDADAVLTALGKAGSISFVDPDGKEVINGKHVKTATAQTINENGMKQYIVSLTLNSKGAKLFGEATTRLAPNRESISIVYDGKTISSPAVQTAILDGKCQIDGQKSFEEADELASTIRIGALPIELKEIRSNVVGAKLGSEAMSKSLLAGAIGFVLVLIFMVTVYRIPGLAASIALCLYIALELVLLQLLEVTLTLPGVAGIILGIGMAVDANVIIFTRIKEELAKGKTVKSAIKVGFNKALSAIVDGNVTTLIAAGVLYFKGSGTVKGFATTLAIGILLSMFTALTITKYVLKAFYALGADDVKYFGTARESKVINYTGNMKKYLAISGCLILLGFAAMGYNGAKGNEILNYGLDFKGGTSSQVPMKDKITSDVKKDVEKAYAKIIGYTPSISEVRGQNAFIIKTQTLKKDKREEVQQMLVKDFGVDKSKITTESISGSVSDEMKQDAVIAVVISTICMLLYIWIRFKDINFGASAVLALLHDVLVVLMVYAVARISVDSTFIACMLTIVGYSINATIVIFDRIRENISERMTEERLAEVVNRSISQTFSRSINTSLTTFIMVFVLYIFGVDSLKDFALPLMAGIICGGYSSICITGTLWYTFKRKFGKLATK